MGFSIVDAHDEWNGALTRPGIVDVATWHSVTVTHDGYGLCRIQLDGNLVAESIVPGPVRSVGPLGLSVGTWPDANEYVFRGFIRALELSTYDPWRALQEYAALKRAQSQAKPEHELAGPAAERFPLRLKSGRVQADFEPLIRMATELSRDPDAAASVQAARSELRRAAALCASYASEGSADQLRNLERVAAAIFINPAVAADAAAFTAAGDAGSSEQRSEVLQALRQGLNGFPISRAGLLDLAGEMGLALPDNASEALNYLNEILEGR